MSMNLKDAYRHKTKLDGPMHKKEKDPLVYDYSVQRLCILPNKEMKNTSLHRVQGVKQQKYHSFRKQEEILAAQQYYSSSSRIPNIRHNPASLVDWIIMETHCQNFQFPNQHRKAPIISDQHKKCVDVKIYLIDVCIVCEDHSLGSLCFPTYLNFFTWIFNNPPIFTLNIFH